MKKWIILNLAITLVACGGALIAIQFWGKEAPAISTSEAAPSVAETPAPVSAPVQLSPELQEIYEGRKELYDSMAHFVNAIKMRDEVALSEHISLPFQLEYPLPALKTHKEVLDYIYAALTPEELNRLFTEHPVQLWEGPLQGNFMCNVAFIWLTHEVPTRVMTLPKSWDSKYVANALAKAQEEEAKRLHPSLQSGTPIPKLSFITENGQMYGRIDELCSVEADETGVSYDHRIALYYITTPHTAAPDVIKYCRHWSEGSAGNEFYQTKDGRFRLDVNHAGPDDFADIDINYPYFEEDDWILDEEKSRTVEYRAKYWVWPEP